MVCISHIVFICEIRDIRGQNFFRDLPWIAELSARWAWVIVGGCRIPGPLAQAIGTAGPLGRNRKPPARRAAFATAFRPSGPTVCIGCSGPTGRVQCVSAQRAIRSNSLAHRARSRNPKTTYHGPTGQPFDGAAGDHRMASPLGLNIIGVGSDSWASGPTLIALAQAI